MIDESVLHNVLVSYKTFLASKDWDAQERYKWLAIKTFQDNWNPDADNYPEMLDRSLSKTANLLASQNSYPRKMIKLLAEWSTDEVRLMFNDLFDESQDVVERIENFKGKASDVLQRYSHGEQNHYQDEHAISVYLWLRYPDKYYIFQFRLIKQCADTLNTGLIFKQGHHKDNLRRFLSFYDELCALLKSDLELSQLLVQKVAGNPHLYADPELKTLTVDVGYYIAKYYQPTGDDQSEDMVSEDLLHQKKKPVAGEVNADDKPENDAPHYWWLVANPKIWTIDGMTVGKVQNYTLYNDNGNKRHIFKNMISAKKGDKVIGYDATPTKQVVGLLEIAEDTDDQYIYFKKTESLANPIDYSALKAIPELANMEFMKNPNGSFFKLTPAEYETLMDLIREDNPLPEKEVIEPYTEKDFLEEVYMNADTLHSLEELLREKKNVILQGAPGVGKTFAARRLAYLSMGEKDKSRVEFVQFHQNYTYEDFVMGYKPDEDGGFKLRTGVFYRFCRRAQSEPERPFFFIIDEINRGNLSKIFGELLMLIENSYRGEEHAMKLAYRDELFYVPKNLYILGMMNTADRSLAMIDYALRRRFSFFEMRPAFESDGFKKYQAALNSTEFDNIIKTVEMLNSRIEGDDSLGAGFCIGHSYFCGQTEYRREWMRNVINYDIKPMLEEYWFDNKDICQQETKKLMLLLNDE